MGWMSWGLVVGCKGLLFGVKQEFIYDFGGSFHEFDKLLLMLLLLSWLDLLL